MGKYIIIVFHLEGYMSFETNKFKVARKKHLGTSQFSVECNVETNVQIDKILSVCHTAQAENAEILNGVINYSGSVDLCILYATVDGEIGTLNSNCPFTSKFEDADIMAGDKVMIKVGVDDYSIDSVTDNNIKINCTLSQSAVLICEREVPNIITNDEDMCVREDEMTVCTLVGQAQEVFVIESDISIKEPVRKVLMVDSCVAVKNVESGVNFVSVAGEVVSRVLYLTENDRFESSYVTENFKEEVELEGVTRDAISEAVACIRRSSVKCEVSQEEKGVDIKLTIPVELKVTSYLEKNEMVIKDIYSTANELEVSTSSFDMTRQLQCDYFETKIDGTLTLDDDKPRVDKIMFVGGSNLQITNSYIKGGEVFVEGVSKTNVVYLNDETNSLNSVVVEVPFVVSDKSSANCENPQIESVFAVLFDVDVVVKKGREFYFDAKLKINVNYDCNVVGAVISNINVAGAYPERDCAIELVFANAGQSAWDIAKTLKVNEQTIMLQNPDLTFPLERDENVIVYFQKQN